MVIFDLLLAGTNVLKEAGIESSRLDAEVLLAHLLHCRRTDLLLRDKEPVTEALYAQYQSLLGRRAAHEPVAYLTGSREFMSLPFYVEKGVLIPRPDTETLVEFVLGQYEKNASVSILDLCTGSGAIAVSLSYYLPKSQVTGIDISPVCVAVAQKNAAQNGVLNRTSFKLADVLKPLDGAPLYDCVVSNPPYIPTEVLHTLAVDVQNYEPAAALDGGNDGLTFYRHLAKACAHLLKPDGLLALEVGHDQADAVSALLCATGCFYSVDTQCDLAGIQRVVYGRRTN